MDHPENADTPPPRDAHLEEARLAALSYIGEAFAEGRHDGLDNDSMARAAIAAGLKELVAIYGEDPVALFIEGFAEKIRRGEYSRAPRH